MSDIKSDPAPVTVVLGRLDGDPVSIRDVTRALGPGYRVEAIAAGNHVLSGIARSQVRTALQRALRLLS